MKIDKITLIAALILSATGCRHDTIPDGVMDTATLRAFLTEAHLIEAYQERANRDNRDTIESQVSDAYNSLCEKYGVTPADYDSSINYYMNDPKILKEVYIRVLDELKKLREENVGNIDPSFNETLDPEDSLFNPSLRKILIEKN